MIKILSEWLSQKFASNFLFIKIQKGIIIKNITITKLYLNNSLKSAFIEQMAHDMSFEQFFSLIIVLEYKFFE